AFLKARRIHFTSDTPDLTVLVHNRSDYYSVASPGDSSFRVFVPAGTYDAMASLGVDRYVIREGIVVTDSATASIRTTDAPYAMQRIPIGEQGQAVDATVGIEWLVHKPTGL